MQRGRESIRPYLAPLSLFIVSPVHWDIGCLGMQKQADIDDLWFSTQIKLHIQLQQGCALFLLY
jgi:hypothetical protein